MTAPVYTTPTPSMWASASTHLEHRIEHIRIDGIRWAVVTSGNSGRVYRLPADASWCPCKWNTETRTRCSHMLSVELQATMDELRSEPVPSFERFRDLYPSCAAGCGQVTEGNTFCEDCSARREREDRLAAARQRVVEAWL